ncbi:hypothetical protein [Burkholderia lata]|uniref:Uncharacterized protein n=1 Tax=Burkholderia lata (strain ATCC 17760 / DSM 23089 / LMG 22485 / NCIMB 9086 / R18194 / 383) TaxID=482957 RepID=A0A6P2GRL0_BURL3|nr:hypothetical protein [Burkholderia lata]VWB07166.1 hypothetical protein BLA6863_00153 [Burkholderia lata]
MQSPYNAQTSVITTTGGQLQTYDITTATVIKGAPGRIFRVNVLVAGSTVGTVNDCLTTGAAAIANQVAAIPDTVGPVVLEWPCATGIVVVPGTGQTLSVSYV